MLYFSKSHLRLKWVFAATLLAVALGSIGVASIASGESAETAPSATAKPHQSDPIRQQINALSAGLANEYIVVFNDTVGRSAQMRQATRHSVQAAGGQINRDYNRIFNLEQLLVRQQDQLARSQGEIALSFIDIYKALGGGWQVSDCSERASTTPAIVETDSTPEPDTLPTPPQLSGDAET